MDVTQSNDSEDAAEVERHGDDTSQNSAADAGSESPEEGAAAMDAAGDAVVDDDKT